jgi:IMP cyclohydrolase
MLSIRSNCRIGEPVLGGLSPLSAMVYPGRFIILGRDEIGEQGIVVYGIMGRSLSSQARKLELVGDRIVTKPTDQDVLKKGNPELLIYPAIIFSRGIAVSNGNQTTNIDEQLRKTAEPKGILNRALRNWDFEPDPPIFTPRIGGYLLSSFEAALGIVRRGEDGSSQRTVFDFVLSPGQGQMICTYAGKNGMPLRPFNSSPLELTVVQRTAKDLAESVYQALEPKNGKQDLRVSVACVFSRSLGKEGSEIFIINRASRMAKSHG